MRQTTTARNENDDMMSGENAEQELLTATAEE